MGNNIGRNLQGSEYNKFLEICLKNCSKFILVERINLNLSEKGKDLIEKMKPFLIKIEYASEWPGTILYDEKAKIYWIALNQNSVMLLKEFADSLFTWKQPELPEDLCFFKENGNPFFITISHEKDGFFTDMHAS